MKQKIKDIHSTVVCKLADGLSRLTRRRWAVALMALLSALVWWSDANWLARINRVLAAHLAYERDHSSRQVVRLRIDAHPQFRRMLGDDPGVLLGVSARDRSR